MTRGRPAASAGRPASSGRVRRDSSTSTSYASSSGVRSRMQLQRTRDTAPEFALRRILHAAGLRYRVDRAPLPGLRRRADIVFTRARVAVYVDGCFWHGCPDHGNSPSANAGYWLLKIAGNRTRDEDTDRRLLDAGWEVIRAWEHEPTDSVAARVIELVRARSH